MKEKVGVADSKRLQNTDGCEIPLRHHVETMVETIAGWYLQGNRIIRAFLGWCEMDFVHPQ